MALYIPSKNNNPIISDLTEKYKYQIKKMFALKITQIELMHELK